jgi:hypothetical protein
MPESPLSKKMKLKPGQRAAVIDAPAGYPEQLAPLPEGVEVSTSLDGTFDWVQIFVKSKAGLDAEIASVRAALKPDSMLWISFPKGSSKVQTALTRDRGWDSVRGLDLKWINLISVGETWSAFSLRPYKAGEPRQSFR